MDEPALEILIVVDLVYMAGMVGVETDDKNSNEARNAEQWSAEKFDCS